VLIKAFCACLLNVFPSDATPGYTEDIYIIPKKKIFMRAFLEV